MPECTYCSNFARLEVVVRGGSATPTCGSHLVMAVDEIMFSFCLSEVTIVNLEA